MISIDEQIADEIDSFELHRQIHCRNDPMMAAKIASLGELKRIREVQVPEEPQEPNIRALDCGQSSLHMVEFYDYKKLRAYAGTLLDLLKRESADAKHYREKSDMLSDAVFQSEERAEAAEAINAAMLKLGEEPSEEMACIGMEAYHSEFGTPITRYMGIFKAMFAKLVEQSKEQAK